MSIEYVLEELVRSDHRYMAFSQRWQGWRVEFREMVIPAGERILWCRKLITIDSVAAEPIWRAMHAVAHLALHYGTRRAFTIEEERRANEQADFWMMWTADGTVEHVGGSDGPRKGSVDFAG